jgi:hemolysin activation/secretion protein
LKFVAGSGNIPFIEQNAMEGRGLRGYSKGKYRGDQLYMLQGEYRWTFWNNFGLVGFGGFGWLVDSPSEIDTHNILPSIGTGIRYMMAEKNRINIGMNIAWGRDDYQFQISFSEAF